MNAATGALLTLRFLIELALLTAWAIVGWNSADAAWLQITLAVALPVLTATVWGLCVSPRARFTWPLAVRVTIELALFVGATAALWAIGYPSVAIALLGLEVAVVVALIASGHPPGPDETGELPWRG